MMKRVAACLLCAALLTGCSALPAEERAFAVCLGLTRLGDAWEAFARLPEYTTPGEYITVSARGNSLAEAMTLLDAAAPIRLHYGQVRLVLLSRELAESDAFSEVTGALSGLGEFRTAAYVCVTESPMQEMMDALTPQSGTRLSKYLEVMGESRMGLGVAPDARLSEIRRMGQRQSPMLADMGLVPEEITGEGGLDASAGTLAAGGLDIQLAGAWLLGLNGRVQGRLTAQETQLVRLAQGTLRKGALPLPEGSLTIIDASSDISLCEKTARCHVSIRYADLHGMTADSMSDAIASAMLAALNKLLAADCDALGLGRRMVLRCLDEETWQALDWPGLYPQMQWQVTVDLQGGA